MKISARNRLKGKIVEVKKGATTAHVRIDVNGTVVTASITNEAVDELAQGRRHGLCRRQGVRRHGRPRLTTTMVRLNEVRAGELQIELPARTDAELYFIGRIRTPWTDRLALPAPGPARRADLPHRAVRAVGQGPRQHRRVRAARGALLAA